jgi:serine/threonine protein phosphatase 1
MTYVVSNLHGCADQFKRLLKEIRFTDNDVMYVLGDIVDIGEQPIELLCDLSMRYNVIPILGDHDYKAFKLLSALDAMLRGESPEPELLSEMAAWMQDGGDKTIAGFKELDEDMREGVLEYLSDMSLYEEVEVSGKRYVLVHAGIANFDEDTPLDEYMPEDFISEPIDVNRQYFSDATVIAGHVPTYTVDGADNGRIYKGEYGYLIDCGAVFGEALGAMRLEDGKKFYVK